MMFNEFKLMEHLNKSKVTQSMSVGAKCKRVDHFILINPAGGLHVLDTVCWNATTGAHDQHTSCLRLPVKQNQHKQINKTFLIAEQANMTHGSVVYCRNTPESSGVPSNKIKK